MIQHRHQLQSPYNVNWLVVRPAVTLQLDCIVTALHCTWASMHVADLCEHVSAVLVSSIPALLLMAAFRPAQY
jgi:hypothetical protein